MPNFIYAGNGLYVGASTDTKPTVPAGYRAYETDTFDEFVSDGTFWWLRDVPGRFSDRRNGWYPSGAGANTGVGLFGSVSSGTGASGQNFSVDTTNNYRYVLGQTGTTQGNKGGFRMNTTVALRKWNPKLFCRFQLNDATNMRLYIGLMGVSEPIGDSTFDAGVVGFLIGFRSTDTLYQVINNDATGSTVVANATTDGSTTITMDTTSQIKVWIVADEANSKFWYKINNGAYQGVTADIPSSTNSLTWMCQCEKSDAAAA